MMKKFFNFLGLLVIVAAVSFGASLAVSRQRNNLARTAADRQALVGRFTGTQEFTGARNGPVKLTTEEASSFVVIPSKNQVRYYHARTGQVKSVSLTGAPKATLVATLPPRASALTWSPDGTEVIAQYGTELRYASIAGNTTKKLNANIFRPVFSHRSNRVAYLFWDQKNGAGAISIADSTLANFKNVLKTRLRNWEIQWTDERKLSLLAIGTRSESLFALDVDKGTLDLIVDAKQNIEALWSPDAAHLLYSRKGQAGSELFLYAVRTRTTTPLKTKGTASQCAWTPDTLTLYCALPEGSESAIGMLTLERATNGFEKLFTPAEAGFVDARDMTYLAVQNSLLFKNFKDGRLYLLSLEK